MSYILDALKKIEQDKLRKNRPDGRVNLAGELFTERKPARRGRLPWLYIGGAGVVALVVCAGIWMMNGRKNRTVVPAPVATQVVPPVNVPVPVVPIPVPQPVQSAAPVVAPPAAPLPVPVTQGVPAATQDDESASGSARKRRLASAVSSPKALPVKPVQAKIQAPADIKLSGIAWQDERGMRRAVVNGFLLKEGTVVSGAKITEILPDRVRFTAAAGQFEIKLDAVMPSEGKQP